MPGLFGGYGNYFLPIYLGASEVAFPVYCDGGVIIPNWVFSWLIDYAARSAVAVKAPARGRKTAALAAAMSDERGTEHARHQKSSCTAW